MKSESRHRILAAAILPLLLIASTSAEAFRCGRKLVIVDMHEVQIRAVCGEPATQRHLGYVQRSVQFSGRHRLSNQLPTQHTRSNAFYTQELELTEYVYNFGPRRLMRRLLFEGGVLVKIETIGYGYHEKPSK